MSTKTHNIMVTLLAVRLKEVAGEEMVVLETVKAMVVVDRVKAEGRIGIVL